MTEIEDPIRVERDDAAGDMVLRFPIGTTVIVVGFVPAAADRPFLKMAGPVSALQLIGVAGVLEEHGRQLMRRGLAQAERPDPATAPRILVPTGAVIG